MPRLDVLEDRTLLNAYTITSLADSGAGSLRQAVLDANASGGSNQITFDPTLQGTIALTSGELTIAANLTITGPGADQIAVSGTDASRVFDIAVGTIAEIDGLTITHGMAVQGGGIQNAGVLTMSGDVVSHNLATDTGVLGGGGILNLAGATLVLTDSTLADNVAALVSTSLGLGGGLDNEGIATLTACTVAGNQAVRGGGVLNQGTIRVTDSTFTANRVDGGMAIGSGGAFNNQRGGTASVFQSTFTGNSAVGVDAGRGGAIWNKGALTLTGVTVSGNLALGGDGADGVNTYGAAIGGGIQSIGQLIITDSVISGNLAQGGNGGNNNPDGSGNDVTFVDASVGGGIEYSGVVGSGLTILNSTITGNVSLGGNVAEGVGALGQGGGIYCENFEPNLQGGSITISGGIIAGNSAIAGPGSPGFRGGTGLGGGMEVEGDPLLATNLTVAGNSVIGGPGGAGAPGGTGFGGGIDLSFDTDAASLINCALLGNLARGGVGGAGADGGNGEGGGLALGAGLLFPVYFPTPDTSSVRLSGVQITGNQAQGGAGDTGHKGGDGLGGGIYAGDATTVTLQSVQVVANRADGAPGNNNGGQAGQGLGGGVYVASGATVTADTDTIMAGNHASTSNDDTFGTVDFAP